MACVFFLVVATPLVLDAPWWLTVSMAGAWLCCLVIALQWFTRRPKAVVLLASVLALSWFAALVLGAVVGEVRLPA